MEIVVACALLGIISLTLLACFSSSFALMESSRENLRATQILQEQTEALRLCTWGQLSNMNFTASYDPIGASSDHGGVLYWVNIITNTPSAIPASASYQTDVRLITISLTWTNWTLNRPAVHSRQTQTQVAKYGLQSYIW